MSTSILSSGHGLWVMQVLVSAFLGICFFQSGMDKILDWKGNLGWLTGHFAKTPLGGMVPLMLGSVTILELFAGILSGLGSLQLVVMGSGGLAFSGAVLASLALTALFAGQRIAKDYPGAAVIVPYFLLSLVAIHLLSQGSS